MSISEYSLAKMMAKQRLMEIDEQTRQQKIAREMIQAKRDSENLSSGLRFGQSLIGTGLDAASLGIDLYDKDQAKKVDVIMGQGATEPDAYKMTDASMADPFKPVEYTATPEELADRVLNKSVEAGKISKEKAAELRPKLILNTVTMRNQKENTTREILKQRQELLKLEAQTGKEGNEAKKIGIEAEVAGATKDDKIKKSGLETAGVALDNTTKEVKAVDDTLDDSELSRIMKMKDPVKQNTALEAYTDKLAGALGENFDEAVIRNQLGKRMYGLGSAEDKARFEKTKFWADMADRKEGRALQREDHRVRREELGAARQDRLDEASESGMEKVHEFEEQDRKLDVIIKESPDYNTGVYIDFIDGFINKYSPIETDRAKYKAKVQQLYNKVLKEQAGQAVTLSEETRSLVEKLNTKMDDELFDDVAAELSISIKRDIAAAKKNLTPRSRRDAGREKAREKTNESSDTNLGIE